MTEEEREKLDKVYEIANKLNDTFFESVDEEKPLITKLRIIVRQWERTNWLGKMLIWLGAVMAPSALALIALWESMPWKK